jgi:hypothetical protein
MARLTEEGKYVRGTPARLNEVVDGEPGVLLRPFQEARLVVELEDGTFEVAHEVLFESWDTLKGWLDEDKEGLLLQEQVVRAATQWKEAGFSPEYLWRGGRLERVQELRDGGRLRVDELGAKFLQRSQEEERLALEREEARQRELKWALRRSKAGYLAQSAALIGPEDPVRSLLLARAAVETEENPETLSQLYEALHLPWVVFTYSVADVLSVAGCPAGDRVAIVSSGALEIRERQGELIAAIKVSAGEVAWSPDSQQLFVATHHDFALYLDAEGRERRRFPLAHGTWLRSPRWSPRGDRVLGVFQPLPCPASDDSFDHRAVLWDLDGHVVAELRGHGGSINCARWHPTGSEILTGSDDRRVMLWSSEGALESVLDHDDCVHDGEWSPSGASRGARTEPGSPARLQAGDPRARIGGSLAKCSFGTRTGPGWRRFTKTVPASRVLHGIRVASF